jgi:hypothetical protein
MQRLQASTEEAAGGPGQLFLDLLPALGRVHMLHARHERDLAILRCVEAIRIYAAAHDGRLPPSLADITEAPVPLDPLYGRPFSYEVAGNKAVLESPLPPGGRTNDGQRYEITLR